MFVVFLPKVTALKIGVRTSWHGLSPERSCISIQEQMLLVLRLDHHSEYKISLNCGVLL